MTELQVLQIVTVILVPITAAIIVMMVRQLSK
jgi:hypothetical protein